ncbi:MAG TPA: ABC transporter permease [Acidimicrobiales bacterium]|nr:ABC transporter permease [Acidimicrobiales bacterium]
MRENGRIMRHAALVAFQDLQGVYSWRSWIVEWITRAAGQIVFFVMIGRLVGSTQAVHFLLVGNVVAIAARSIFLAVPSTVWERYAGTLPLLVAAPASPVVVFLGRSVEWILDGFVSSIVALAILAPLFRLALPWPDALLFLPLMLVTCLSVYMAATFFGSLALRLVDGRNLIGITMSTSLLLLCGVNVSLDSLPAVLRGVAQFVPLTHGLLGVRALLSEAGAGTVVAQAAAELGVGLLWAAIAIFSFSHFAEGGRKDGSIEFGS